MAHPAPTRMSSTLASQPLLKTLSFCSSVLPLCHRPIRHSRGVHAQHPAGLTASELPGYRRTRLRRLSKIEICLWDQGQRIGVMTMGEVMRTFLGPGKTLSWRPADRVLRTLDRESRRADGSEIETSGSDKPKNDVLHYEIISISESKNTPTSAIRRTPRKNGAAQVFLRSNSLLSSPSLQGQLASAYNILGDPEAGGQCPIEFHLLPPRGKNSHRSIRWALRNRVDLRPDVIKQAMPHGVRYMKVPHTREDCRDTFWTVVAKHYGRDAERPGKANRTRTVAITPAQPSPERQAEFEQTLKKALQRQRCVIHNKFQKSLQKTVKRRLKTFNGGPTAPLPEERSKTQERERAALERTLTKVRNSVERKFGIEPGSTAVAEDGSVDGSKMEPLSPMAGSKR